MLARPRHDDLQIADKHLRRNHPNHRTNQPQRQVPNHNPNRDLFPEPGVLIGWDRSGGAVGRFALGQLSLNPF